MPEPVVVCRRAYRSFLGFYLAAGLLAVAIWAVGLQERVDVPLPFTVVGGFVPPLAAWLFSWLAVLSTEWRIFEDSIETDTGLIARRIGNVQIFRIRDLALRQSILNRLLGVGDVLVTSTDQSTPHLAIRGVRDPRAVYDTLRELVSRSAAARRTMIVEEEPPGR
jgi:uncharacterized membrane protein YdbT with pleckstrin-like domain